MRKLLAYLELLTLLFLCTQAACMCRTHPKWRKNVTVFSDTINFAHNQFRTILCLCLKSLRMVYIRALFVAWHGVCPLMLYVCTLLQLCILYCPVMYVAPRSWRNHPYSMSIISLHTVSTVHCWNDNKKLTWPDLNYILFLYLSICFFR